MPQMIPGTAGNDEDEETAPLTMERYFPESKPAQKEESIATSSGEKPTETSKTKTETASPAPPLPQISAPQSPPEPKISQYGGISVRR